MVIYIYTIFFFILYYTREPFSLKTNCFRLYTLSLECIIDNRERGLIKLLNNIPDEVRITIDTLDVGDIVFRNDSSIVLVIERKTVADLDASIIDGRHREQKARLFASESRFMYVIEGDIRKSINYEVASGSIINTINKDTQCYVILFCV